MSPTQPETEAEGCALCGELPDDLLVNTGREEYFPHAFYQLTRLSSQPQEPFRRCPACGMFFYWIDLPQMYGSGNCDEERCIRLSARVSPLLDHLFPPDSKNPGDLGDLDEYFEALPLALLLLVLGRHVYTGPKIVAPFVPGLVQLLAKTNDASIRDLLSNYRSNKPDRAEEILEAFRSLDDPGLSVLAQVIRDCLRIAAKRMTLLETLRRTSDLVADSQKSDGAAWTAEKIHFALKEMISAIEHGADFDRVSFSTLFAPTGPVQEMAMVNGWSEEMMRLAAIVDDGLSSLCAGDSDIPIGRRHRTLCDVEMLVYDFDQLGVETVVVPSGSIFQPWKPLAHWRGVKVPITLGGAHAEFDWGIHSGEGRFLHWDDFFSKCELEESDRLTEPAFRRRDEGASPDRDGPADPP